MNVNRDLIKIKGHVEVEKQFSDSNFEKDSKLLFTFEIASKLI